MRQRPIPWVVLVLAVVLAPPRSAVAGAQTTSGSIAGIVHDAQAAPVPGATVTLTNNQRGDVLTVTTAPNGTFTFPQVQPGTYTLRVTLEGFKTVERTNVVLNANDKLNAGTVVLDVGALSETVSVTSRVTELKTESAERGYALEGKVLQDVAVNSRSYLALVGLTPGVVSTANLTVAGHAGLGNISANGARFNQNNLTLDGVGNVDTGNNGDQLATLSLDAVAEFKVLTANYQAEYGRSSGAQISVVSKSGGRDFHGSGNWYKRHDSLNATNWINNRDGLPKNALRLDDVGYTIGGPVFVPEKFNSSRSKLFFFWSQEFQKQLRPQTLKRIKLPTELERQGDFSQSVDNNGNPFPFVRDATTGLPCNAGNTSGCFQFQGALGRIDPARLYQPGLNILRMYPLPNTTGQGFNYTSQVSDSYPRREDMIRIDWTPTTDWRVFGRYVNNSDKVTSNYGSFVLGTNLEHTKITDARPGRAFALSVTKIINSTTSNEIVTGFGYNRINIDPVDDSLTREATGLTGLPLLFPSAVQNDFIPRFDFGTRARGGNQSPQIGTNNAPFFNYNRTTDIIDNFTKVFSKHSMKAGVYFQYSQKDQTSFANANGDINFGDTTANPIDTGYGYANAALGIFNTYNQASQYATGKYRYKNVEWYVQDNWKATGRLTLDYGLRFYYIEPQYDSALQTSTFLADLWNPASAPRLFEPAIINGARSGFDPVTGTVVAATFIGRLVPNSGDLLNGIRQAGQGVNKYLMKNNGVLYAPRFGFTYDLTGRQAMIVRGGGGVFYDRFQGNETFDMITNPPTTFAPTVQFGRLQDLGSASQALLAPSGLNAFAIDGKIPTVYNYNLGIQTKLPYLFVLDVSYIGSQSRHLLQRRNINAVPYGAAFDPANQDPTLAASSTPGGSSLPADFLRPFPGYGTISLHEMSGNANYNALQTTLDRRFSKGLLFGISYTYGKALGTTNGGDGDFHRIDNLDKQANYGPLNQDRRHNFVANFVYELPRFSSHFGSGRAASLALDEWQISGIYRVQSGAPYTPGFSISGIGNQNLTGSFTEGARIGVTGDAGAGNSGDPYHQLNTAAFTPPRPGSIGLESGRNWLTGPGINNLDVSIQKSFPLRGTTRLELRADAFNALNHTQFSGVNATANYTSLTATTPSNLPFDANGKFIFANRNGFGTVNGARDPRIIQLAARIRF
jgi:hypothetical protein